MYKIKSIKKFLHEKFPDSTSLEENDLLYKYGKFEDALLYSTLYMPELVEIEGHILLRENLGTEELIQRFKEAINNPDNNMNEVENSFNLLEVPYAFSDSSFALLEDEELLAYKIKNAWEGWLKVNYPERQFIVTIEEMSDDEGHWVFFHEKRE